jgi:hypothetical protein
LRRNGEHLAGFGGVLRAKVGAGANRVLVRHTDGKRGANLAARRCAGIGELTVVLLVNVRDEIEVGVQDPCVQIGSLFPIPLAGS